MDAIPEAMGAARSDREEHSMTPAAVLLLAATLGRPAGLNEGAQDKGGLVCLDRRNRKNHQTNVRPVKAVRKR
jgi:hypothetical protein